MMIGFGKGTDNLLRSHIRCRQGNHREPTAMRMVTKEADRFDSDDDEDIFADKVSVVDAAEL